MSAMGGSVPVRSSTEIVSGGDSNRERLGGVVVSLRHQLPRNVPQQQWARPTSELGPISPELALVDPELGRAAQALLPDLPRATPVVTRVAVPALIEQPAFVERLRSSLEPIPDLAPHRRRVSLGRVSSAAALVALGVLLTLVIGPANPPDPRQPQVQSAAGAVSTPAAAPATRSTASPSPAATSSKAATSAALHAPALRGQTFAWVAAPQAAAYEFQLFQGGERIFRARVDKPRFDLPGRWRQAGRPYALVPGSYRWYVWPVSSRTKRQSTVAIVQAKLVIG
jgi:hypothetical protein